MSRQADIAIASDPVPSPCNSICTMNPTTALCDGCLRTIAEIVAWGSASEESKRLIWRAIGEREDKLFS